jgi:hypothetical protein
LWIAARAQGVDLRETGEQLRRLLSGLKGLAQHERGGGARPRFARALALDEMAAMWRRHGLGAADESDPRFIEAAVAMYRDDAKLGGFGFAGSERRAVLAAIRHDLGIIAVWREVPSQA